MDNRIQVRFAANQEHQEAWKAILNGLCENLEAGMAFHDRMLEHFGEEVDACLEELLESWGTEVFYVETWEREGARFLFEIPATSDWEELVEDLKKLFSLCPVSDLVIEFIPDGDE